MDTNNRWSEPSQNEQTRNEYFYGDENNYQNSNKKEYPGSSRASFEPENSRARFRGNNDRRQEDISVRSRQGSHGTGVRSPVINTNVGILSKVAKWVFIALFLVEVYYCYMWLIQPLMPLIQNIIDNQGVPSINYSMSGYDIAHPLGNFSVGGISGDNALILFKNTSIRLALFGFIFGITGKAYRMVMMMVRS